MSSPSLRITIKDYMTANWTSTPWYDLSDYVEIDALPAVGDTTILALQFLPSSETLATIGGEGNQGWREQGSFIIHMLWPTGISSDLALAMGEQLRDMFRARRFGDHVIESVAPFVDYGGAAIGVNGKWHGWAAPVSFYKDACS